MYIVYGFTQADNTLVVLGIYESYGDARFRYNEVDGSEIGLVGVNFIQIPTERDISHAITE